MPGGSTKARSLPLRNAACRLEAAGSASVYEPSSRLVPPRLQMYGESGAGESNGANRTGARQSGRPLHHRGRLEVAKGHPPHVRDVKARSLANPGQEPWVGTAPPAADAGAILDTEGLGYERMEGHFEARCQAKQPG
jgi:hypothetical protein